MAKKKVEVVEEVEAVEVEPVVEVEELPVVLPTKWTATIMTGVLAKQPFTYQDGAPHVRVGVNQNPVALNQVSASVLNPHGDNAQVKLSIVGAGDSVISLPREDATSLVASISRSKAANPAQATSLMGRAVNGIRQTVAKKTGGCKSCGG